MNKICTDIEQSKKLIELGIDISTADMVYLKSYFEDEEEYSLLVGSYHEGYTEKDDGTIVPVFDEHIPAWSLSALLELIPPGNILLRDALSSEYKCINTVDSCYYDNPLDAAFEMVCWLKENGKL